MNFIFTFADADTDADADADDEGERLLVYFTLVDRDKERLRVSCMTRGEFMYHVWNVEAQS